MLKLYDQTKDKRTTYSCSVYTQLNIILFDFGVQLKDSRIYKIVAYFEKIGVLLPKGAFFSIIYPAMAKLIEWKTGLKLKVKTGYISKGLDEVSTWGLGSKKLSSLSIKLAQNDGWLTKEEMRIIADSGKGGGHNHAVKKGNKSGIWTIIESWGGISYKTSLSALREAVMIGIYYDTARTLVPADGRTENIQKACIKEAKKLKRPLTYEEFKVKASIFAK